MIGKIQAWLQRQSRRREQRAIDARNAERRGLCAEYPHANPMRKGEIIHRLTVLNGEADIRGASARVAFELEGICRRVHADSIRRTPSAPQAHDHMASDLKHFRKEYCE